MKDVAPLFDWCCDSPEGISHYFTFNNCGWHNTLYLRRLLWIRNSLKMMLSFSEKPTGASQGQSREKSIYSHSSEKYQPGVCWRTSLFTCSCDEGGLVFGLRVFISCEFVGVVGNRTNKMSNFYVLLWFVHFYLELQPNYYFIIRMFGFFF